MKVRIRKENNNLWKIEIKHWYCPWWVQVGTAPKEEWARECLHSLIKHPKIIEIK